MRKSKSIQGHQYWLIRDRSDQPIELVRSTPHSNVVVAGEGKGTTQHKRSAYFTSDHTPDLRHDVTFELIHAGDASSPAIGLAIDEVDACFHRRQQRVKKRGRYAVSDAKLQVSELLASGSSIREASRLCGVPKSTVSDWLALTVR